MYSVLVLVAQALLATLSVAQIRPYPEVTIAQGTLRGKYELSRNGRQYAAFQGIPYAQPPIGKLRFKEPQNPQPWIGVYEAIDLRPECLQYSHLSYDVQGDEDCLHLNVYTPNVPPNADSSLLLDVIVYIHGGAFMFLNGYTFGPRYLMDRDVIYVNLNYRLGPLGFLSTGDTIIPGNNGLKDQSAALRWVQRNIRAFGGNPASITLMGLSAGGVSVHYHYLSPLSQGLFTRGISFSGTVLCSWATMDNAREKAIQLGNSVGCNTEDSTELLHCLRHRPGHQIVQQSKQFMGWLYNPYSPFGPTVEAIGSKTPFVTQDPYDILKSGSFQHIPWITSVTSEEGLYPAAEFCSSPEKLQELETRWNEILPNLLDFNLTVEQELKSNVCMDIQNYYLKNKSVSKNVDQVIQMVGDRLFVSCAEEAAKIQARTSSAPVYFYYYSYRGAQSLSNVFTHNKGSYGVSHGDDVFYFLNNPYVDPETTENDKQMVQKFLDFVTSYAINGIPRFTPDIVLPDVKGGLPALEYLHVKSPINFVQEKTTDLGHSKFWLNLPLRESINIANKEALPSGARDEL